MKPHKPITRLGILGLLLLTITISDMLFYWPATGATVTYLIFKSITLFAAAYLTWEHLIKPKLSATGDLNEII